MGAEVGALGLRRLRRDHHAGAVGERGQDRRERRRQVELDRRRVDDVDARHRPQLAAAVRAGHRLVALDVELDGGGVELLAVVEGDVGAQLDRQRLAVGRPLVAGRELRHDGELLVDVEQLVAKRREDDPADEGARQRRVEHVGVFGQADAQRVCAGAANAAPTSRAKMTKGRARRIGIPSWTSIGKTAQCHASRRAAPARRGEGLDVRFDAVALQHADRVGAAGEAGDERLEALQALRVQAPQLGDRLGVIVDAQVEARIVLGGVDAQRRRLLAALVAAGRLAGGQRREEPLGERPAGAGDESLRGRVEHVGAGEHVAGDAEVVVHLVAAPVDALRAGVGGAAAVRADQVQLALGAAFVGVGEPGDDVLGGDAFGEQRDAGRSVERVHQRLRRQRADRAPRVHAERADREEAAGDGDAEGAVGRRGRRSTRSWRARPSRRGTRRPPAAGARGRARRAAPRAPRRRRSAGGSSCRRRRRSRRARCGSPAAGSPRPSASRPRSGSPRSRSCRPCRSTRSRSARAPRRGRGAARRGSAPPRRTPSDGNGRGPGSARRPA